MNTEDRNHAKIYSRAAMNEPYDPRSYYAAAYTQPPKFRNKRALIEIEKPNSVQAIFMCLLGTIGIFWAFIEVMF